MENEELLHLAAIKALGQTNDGSYTLYEQLTEEYQDIFEVDREEMLVRLGNIEVRITHNKPQEVVL